jgi:ABC-type bacteriocin/lantibiotic exporter with double-glycine peptidase domain
VLISTDVGHIVNQGNMHHMVVVDGLDDLGRVKIHDPWEGSSYSVELDDFLNHWTEKAVVQHG